MLVGSYWDRGTRSQQKILAMLTEARDIAYAAGDVELRTEAMNWRVSLFLAQFAMDDNPPFWTDASRVAAHRAF